MKRNPVHFIHLSMILGLAFAPTLASTVRADEAEVEKVEAEETKSPTKQESWTSGVQTKYSLTDEQMKSLSNSGLKGPHLAFAAELAKQSGKPIDEVVAMRTTEKMGWGAIAKKLGVPPGSLGQSVSSLRHDLKDNRDMAKKEQKAAEKEEKAAAKEERKEAKAERKAERRAERDARKSERKEAKAERKSH